MFKISGKGTASGRLNILKTKPIPPGAYTQEEFDKLVEEGG